MAQVTVYLPAEVLEAARKQAGQHRSLSAWISALIRRESLTEWPRSLVTCSAHGRGDLVEPDDPPPEDDQVEGDRLIAAATLVMREGGLLVGPSGRDGGEPGLTCCRGHGLLAMKLSCCSVRRAVGLGVR